MYSLISIGLAVAIPFFCLYSFKAGIRFSTKPEKEAEKPIIKKKRKPSNDEKRKAIEMENINNYENPWSKQHDLG